jgi:hypothetical protein
MARVSAVICVVVSALDATTVSLAQKNQPDFYPIIIFVVCQAYSSWFDVIRGLIKIDGCLRRMQEVVLSHAVRQSLPSDIRSALRRQSNDETTIDGADERANDVDDDNDDGDDGNDDDDNNNNNAIDDDGAADGDNDDPFSAFKMASTLTKLLIAGIPPHCIIAFDDIHM